MRMRTLIALAVVTFLFSSGASTPGEGSQSITAPALQLTKPAGIDLDVMYISRTPLYSRYSVLYTADGRPYLQPGTESEKRWPAQGELVTFTAHIKNKGTMASGTFAFKWFVDGTQVATGTHGSLSAGQEATESYQWTWAHASDGERLLGEHTIKIVVDPNNLISETYESNNFVEDRTDAISLYLAVTPQVYTALETPINSDWPFSAEDWLQKQIAAMNAAFVRSVYPSLPNGIPERVRLDQIFVTSSDPVVGLGLDGGFFMTADDRSVDSYYDPVNDVSGGLIHELTHQLGIIDMYNLDAVLEIAQVTDQFGQPIQTEFSSGTLSQGLMNNPGIQPPVYEEHTALALNANKGYRRGYYGEYLYDISNQVRLRILDNLGASAAGVTVNLYQRSFGPALFGSFKGTIDNTPEFSGITDQDGTVLLSNRAVTTVTTNTGHILHDNPFGPINIVGNNDEFILELRKGDYQEFRWLDITAFNLAMWQSGSDLTVIRLRSHLPATQAVLPPANLTGVQESGVVKLQWSPSPSLGSVYNVYRTDNSSSQYQRVATDVNALSFSEPYSSNLRETTYVVTAVNPQGYESGFSNPFYAFRLENPSALVVDEQNNRVVLDPQNGYALLYQLGNGTLFDTRGSVDYHLEFSRYMARDADGHLILSHPGDFYSSRHSVRVTDQDANPLFEFGTQGSGAGEFQTPAGVAAWGQSCGIQGPYAVDNHTLLLLHFDNSYDGAQGEVGSPSGVSFADGKYAQAVVMDSNDTLTYPTIGNLNRTQGAIEFWIRPHWNGNDNQSYTFFEVGNSWFNRMRIMKDGANNLRFMLWNSSTEYGVAYNVGQWQAGEWHHVAATWAGTNIALFVDGQQVANSNTANVPDSLGATIYVGVASALYQEANADIDELRISDTSRIGNSDTCSYRILVADSGNNRIQAFDGQGNFVASYGSFGSGTGQFKNPQGLAVDASGNVIVADSGNNRLQVLSFNGASFGFVRSITANLNAPMGISTDPLDRVLVADTGHSKIKVLSMQGELLAEYTSPNDGSDGTFDRPRGVVVDNNGRIIVADTGNKRIVSILDESPVKVLLVTCADPDPTSAASVNFTVSFSKPVTGVDTSAPFSDFALTITGSVTGASITNVTGSGSTYMVTVNTGSGHGTIRLDVVDNNTIIDAVGNPLGGVKRGDGNFVDGEAYTIVPNVNVVIGGQSIAGYHMPVNGELREQYSGLDAGPVRVQSIDGLPIIAALRDLWWNGSAYTSSIQLMGLPQNLLSDTYIFPSYNNVNLNDQLRFGNVGNAPTTVTVTIGGVMMGTYNLQPNQREKVSYPGLDSGPVMVKSSNGLPIIASIRDAWINNGVTTSYSQLMGLPENLLSDTYVFPSYNNVSLSDQLRFGNVGNTPTTVTVTVGGQLMGTYNLQPNQRQKVSYANLDSGPVIIQSSNGVPIIVSLREAWLNNGVTTSYFQMMGLPQSQLSDKYVFPSYDNVTLSGQLRFGNVGNVNTTVTVTIGGQVMGTYDLSPNQRQKVSYAGLNSGPIVVQSSNGVPIIAALRDAWLTNGVTTSFSQLMGLPGGQMSSVYVFPSYNNVTYDNQLRIGVP